MSFPVAGKEKNLLPVQFASGQGSRWRSIGSVDNDFFAYLQAVQLIDPAAADKSCFHPAIVGEGGGFLQQGGTLIHLWYYETTHWEGR